ncbi:helix-turn-helix domain-containing protein [Corynebacterium bovis]|uniref:helix-turn-helix domain-containing protein n=1 Tax=Corynebacterium bovis TaxID=36808 RepID=UPI003CC74D98
MRKPVVRGWIPERLRSDREGSELTRRQLASSIGVSAQAIKLWETRDQAPLPSAYVKLCETFGRDRWHYAPIPVAQRTLQDYRTRSGYTLAQIAERIGISEELVRQTELGHTDTMSGDQIAIWSAALGIPVTAWWSIYENGRATLVAQ